MNFKASAHHSPKVPELVIERERNTQYQAHTEHSFVASSNYTNANQLHLAPDSAQ